ncbi:MAG TPA: carbamate kinase [Gaiellaceae bacterium]|nr:carbamate kinase [Gaiellaceae bacterium]
MRLVVALGGNALLRRGERAEAAVQQAHVREAVAALAALAERHELVITHGNGPQVGLLALEADAYTEVAPYPLDVLGAESQGMIGYFLTQSLAGRTGGRGVVAVLTQVVVDENDAAFARPTKPIGPVYDGVEAARLAAERGWTVAADGPHVRRVVASPEPREIVELAAIERLLAAGQVVVCAGGGGIPVVRRNGGLAGVEAVVDKDLTACLLAESLSADRLVMLTDVECVERGWGTSGAVPIHRTSPVELRALDFAPGSMAPKVEAACRFVERTGGRAAIGSLDDVAGVVAGSSGTQVRSVVATVEPRVFHKSGRSAAV